MAGIAGAIDLDFRGDISRQHALALQGVDGGLDQGSELFFHYVVVGLVAGIGLPEKRRIIPCRASFIQGRTSEHSAEAGVSPENSTTNLNNSLKHLLWIDIDRPTHLAAEFVVFQLLQPGVK